MNQIDQLKDAVAIVTGGSRGYGFGMAESLAREGVQVVITGRDSARLETISAKYSGLSIRPFQADASSSDDWDRLTKFVISHYGRLDILINNSGEGVQIAPASVQTDESIHRSIASNLTGAILGSCRAAQIMKRQESGLIINVGSVCAKHAWPDWSVYSAAKAGLLQFTRCLLTEMRPHNVRVTSLIPSWGQTEFIQSANLQDHTPDVLNRCISQQDIGDLVVQIAGLPSHLVAEEITLWPMVQPIAQL